MKFLIKGDSEPVVVAGFKELVEHMNKTATSPSASPMDYMLDYSKRSVMFRDVDIRATDFKSFVEDLITVGDVSVVVGNL